MASLTIESIVVFIIVFIVFKSIVASLLEEVLSSAVVSAKFSPSVTGPCLPVDWAACCKLDSYFTVDLMAQEDRARREVNLVPIGILKLLCLDV